MTEIYLDATPLVEELEGNEPPDENDLKVGRYCIADEIKTQHVIAKTEGQPAFFKSVTREEDVCTPCSSHGINSINITSASSSHDTFLNFEGENVLTLLTPTFGSHYHTSINRNIVLNDDDDMDISSAQLSSQLFQRIKEEDIDDVEFVDMERMLQQSLYLVLPHAAVSTFSYLRILERIRKNLLVRNRPVCVLKGIMRLLMPTKFTSEERVVQLFVKLREEEEAHMRDRHRPMDPNKRPLSDPNGNLPTKDISMMKMCSDCRKYLCSICIEEGLKKRAEAEKGKEKSGVDSKNSAYSLCCAYVHKYISNQPLWFQIVDGDPFQDARETFCRCCLTYGVKHVHYEEYLASSEFNLIEQPCRKRGRRSVSATRKRRSAGNTTARVQCSEECYLKYQDEWMALVNNRQNVNEPELEADQPSEECEEAGSSTHCTPIVKKEVADDDDYLHMVQHIDRFPEAIPGGSFEIDPDDTETDYDNYLSGLVEECLSTRAPVKEEVEDPSYDFDLDFHGDLEKKRSELGLDLTSMLKLFLTSGRSFCVCVRLLVHAMEASYEPFVDYRCRDLFKLCLKLKMVNLDDYFGRERKPYQKPRRKLQLYSVFSKAWSRQNGEPLIKHAHRLTPCFHAGPCGKRNPACICGQNSVPCTNLCRCSASCSLRFPGCRCRSGTCRTKLCPCFLAKIECDPKLCLSCTAGLHCLPTDETDIVVTCQNLHLTLGKPKKVKVASSSVPGINGFGLFADEKIPNKAFITEYCGQVVSTDEADMRASVDEHERLSYQFKINEEEVIVSKHYGNQARYINHSKEPNVRAQICLVGTQHRVALFADGNIKEGEELFIDYGAEFFEADVESNRNFVEHGLRRSKRVRNKKCLDLDLKTEESDQDELEP